MAFFDLFRRKQKKADLALTGREAAVTFTRDRSIVWLPSAEDMVNPPAATRREILRLARYMVTNHSLCERALQVSEAYTVGQGIVCNAATADQEFNEAATGVFDGWSNSVFSSNNNALTFYQ